MKRKRFTQEPITGVPREQEAGAKVADLCRRHGISDATFREWNAGFGSMEVSDAKRLKSLEDENARLKKLLAERMPNAAASRELLSKMPGPAAVKPAQTAQTCPTNRVHLTHRQATMGLSERRACTIVAADRTTIRYRFRRAPELELRKKLRDPGSSAASLVLTTRRLAYQKRRRFQSLLDEGLEHFSIKLHRILRRRSSFCIPVG